MLKKFFRILILATMFGGVIKLIFICLLYYIKLKTLF